MRAAVYRGKGDIRIEEIEEPEVQRGEILVKVEACGVCPTDIKKVQKGLLPPPRIFGHEICGLVARLGPGVSRFQEGQRVVVHHHIPCGTCFFCQVKAYAQCADYKRNGTTAGFEPSGGGFAEYVKAFDWIVEGGTIPVPEGVSAEEASFVEPVNTCLKAIQKAGLRKGETVLVVGQGPIGLILTQLALWAGAHVFASDTLEDRLALAVKFGAEAALDAREDVSREVLALTGGRGVDCALLAAVGQAAFDQAVTATRLAGRIVVFSATSRGEIAEVDLGVLCPSEKDLLTSYSASVDVQDLAARLVFTREIRVRELISHRFALEDTAAAFDVAARPTVGTLKAVVDMTRRRA